MVRVLASMLAVSTLACSGAASDDRREDDARDRSDATVAELAIDAGASDARLGPIPADAGLVCERPEELLDLDRACAWHHLGSTLWFCPRAVKPPASACVVRQEPMTFPGGAVICSTAEPCWCCP